MTDLDRRLHELMGKCWHNYNRTDVAGYIICQECRKRKDGDGDNPSYLDPVNYWELLQWCKSQDRWRKFLESFIDRGEGTSVYDWYYDAMKISDIFLNPARGCEAIDKFDWRKK